MHLSIWTARLTSLALVGLALPAGIAAYGAFHSNGLALFVVATLFGAPAAAVACWGTLSWRGTRVAQCVAFVLCVVGFFALVSGLVDTVLPVHGGWSDISWGLSAAFHWAWLMRLLLRHTEEREEEVGRLTDLVRAASGNPKASMDLPPLTGWQRVAVAGSAAWMACSWLLTDAGARYGWDDADVAKFLLLSFVVPPAVGLVGIWVARGFQANSGGSAALPPRR